MRRVTMVLVLLGLIAIPSYASAYPPNFGFESGDTTNWTQSLDTGYIGVFQQVNLFEGGSDPVFTYTAPEGDWFALIAAGEQDSPQALSRTITLGPGEKVEGWAAFISQDWPGYGYDDTARVTISDAVTLDVLWQQSVDLVDPAWYTDWQHWSYTSPASETKDYLLTY